MPQFISSLPIPADVDAFVAEYLETAEWTDCSEDSPENHNAEGWSQAAIDCAKIDCEDFRTANAADLAAYEKATGWSGATDFWLTRNGHGAGFWDRGLGDLGKRLSTAAKYGSLSVYVGADGLLYLD